MGFTYGFFDAELDSEGKYDRAYHADQFAEYFSLIVSNGVFPTPSTQLQVIANTPADMGISVSEGYGWVNGYFGKNDSLYSLPIQTASGSLSRVDAVVLRWVKETRSMGLAIKTGTPSSSPARPSPTRNSDVYELILAYISISPGATRVTQSMITDTRNDAALCGIVTGAVKSIDATNLFAQYDAAFQEWFESLKTQLGDNVATNLQLQINDRVKISDKASTEEALSGSNNDKWMTPKTTKESIEATAFRVGDIKYSGRDLEGEPSSKYLLCDGRVLSTTAYSELNQVLNGRFGYIPSEEFITTVFSQARADYSRGIRAYTIDSNGVITALVTHEWETSPKVVRITKEGEFLSNQDFPISRGAIGTIYLFHIKDQCYAFTSSTSNETFYIHSISDSGISEIWKWKVYDTASGYGFYSDDESAYMVCRYKESSSSSYVVGIFKLTGTSVAVTSLPLSSPSDPGCVIDGYLYFGNSQASLSNIAVSSISDPEISAFLSTLNTAPTTYSRDGLRCGHVLGTKAYTLTKKEDGSFKFNEYSLLSFLNSQGGESVSATYSGMGVLEFLEDRIWVAVRTSSGGTTWYVGVSIGDIVPFQVTVSGPEYPVNSNASEGGPKVGLSRANKNISGSTAYDDTILTKVDYQGSGFKIPDLIAGSDSGLSGLPVAYIKARS